MKDFRKWLFPSNRVFTCNQSIHGFCVNEDTPYKSVYSEEEIAKMISTSGKKNVFNGTCIRLDNVVDGICYLSKVGFYDFLVSNLTYLPANKNLMFTFDMLRCYVFDPEFRSVLGLESRIKTRVKGYKTIRSFEDVLEVKELANIVTVSVLLEDVAGNVLLVKRGNRVAVSSEVYAVSLAGSVAEEDLSESDPFLSCAIRELKEELNLEISLQCTEIVISRQKLQPAVLFYGKHRVKFTEVIDTMVHAIDFKEENSSLFAVPKKKVMGFVHQLQFTDVAAYQLFQISGCSYRQWLLKYCNRRELEKYKIF